MNEKHQDAFYALGGLLELYVLHQNEMQVDDLKALLNAMQLIWSAAKKD